MHAGHQGVDRCHNEEVNRRGHQQKRDAGIDEFADRKRNAVNSKCETGKIAVLADECSDQRREQVLGQRCDHAAERGADDHAHRHIHHIAAQDEFLESVEALAFEAVRLK